MKRILRLLFYGILILVTITTVAVVTPAHFDVIRLQERPGTKYWQLSTGSKIAYVLIEGKGVKKSYPLIYLHGGPGAGVTNREVETLGKLSDDGYDVYLYDQIGCGLSGRLENIKDYSPERHKNDLTEIIKNIRAEKVVLLGQSWGSILALMYLGEKSGKVDKLIITAPGNIQPIRRELENIAVPDSIHLKSHYIDKRYQLITKNIRARAIIYAAMNFDKKLAPDTEADQLLTFLTTDLNKSMVCDTSNAVIAEGTEGFYSHYMTLKQLNGIKDQREILKNINVPVLIMKGECDIQPWEYTAEYFEIFPRAQFRLIKNGGHNLYTEQPEQYIHTIRAFLNDE